MMHFIKGIVLILLAVFLFADAQVLLAQEANRIKKEWLRQYYPKLYKKYHTTPGADLNEKLNKIRAEDLEAYQNISNVFKSATENEVKLLKKKNLNEPKKIAKSLKKDKEIRETIKSRDSLKKIEREKKNFTKAREEWLKKVPSQAL